MYWQKLFKMYKSFTNVVEHHSVVIWPFLTRFKTNRQIVIETSNSSIMLEAEETVLNKTSIDPALMELTD